VAEDGNQGTNDDGNGGTPAPVESISIADLKTAGLADSYFTPEGGLNTKDLIEHLTDRASRCSAADARAAAVPQDGKYDFALSKNFKLPDGVTAPDGFLQSWKVSDAKAEKFAAYAKAKGLSQQEVSEFVNDWALADAVEKMEIARQMQADQEKAEKDVEKLVVEKLGQNWQERDNNLRAKTDAVLGVKGIGHKITFADPETFLAFEKFLNDVGSKMAGNAPAGGGGSNPNAELAAKIGTPGFKAMDIFNAATQG